MHAKITTASAERSSLLCQFQKLESRLLFSEFATLNSRGTLSVVGDSRNDQIRIDDSHARITASRNGQVVSYAASRVKRIWVDGKSGRDRIENNSSLPSTLIGGNGNDTLVGGLASDFCQGGYGDDLINGRQGLDRVSYFDHKAGVHAGIDAFSSEGDATVVTGSGGQTGTEEFDQFESIEQVEGSNFGDSLGSFGNLIAPEDYYFSPLLIGLNGDDVFEGGFFINGSSAGVIMNGDGGNDTFTYYAAGNEVNGGAGDDTIIHGDDDDASAGIDGGDGFDTEFSSPSSTVNGIIIVAPNVEKTVVYSADSVFGSNRDDIIEIRDALSGAVYGGGGSDRIELIESDHADEYQPTIYGQAGNDTLIGRSKNDRMYGGSGNDLMIGNSGNDLLFGGAGNDTLIGGAGRDRLDGQFGNDVLRDRDGRRDTLIGGDGYDSAERDDAHGVFDAVSGVEMLT